MPISWSDLPVIGNLSNSKPAAPTRQGPAMPVPNAPPTGFSNNPKLLAIQLSNAQKAYDLANDPATKTKAIVDLNIAKENLNRLKNKPQEFTEGQGIWGSRASLMMRGEKDYEDAVRAGYEPSSYQSKFGHFVNSIPIINEVTPALIDEATQRGMNAEARFREGFARGQSQSNISESAQRPELQRLGKEVLPGAWGETSNDVRRDRYYSRMDLINESLRAAGKPPIPVVPFEKTSLYKAPPKQSKPMPSEEDIQHTMKVNNMSRNAVLKALGY